MTDTAQERQTVHHLTDTRLRSHLAGLEISRCERGFHTDVNNRRLENFIDIRRINNILELSRGFPRSIVNLLHNRGLHILDDLGSEIEAEEIAEQIARKFHLLIWISVAVVAGNLVMVYVEHFPRHCSQKARLLVQHLPPANMGQKLFRQNFANEFLLGRFDGRQRRRTQLLANTASASDMSL